MMQDLSSIHVLAPAKINLNLHVTGKREDGYHEIQSLIVFADWGDNIEIFSNEDFSFQIKGPFAEILKEHSIDCKNLAVRAARAISEFVQKPLNCSIHLSKNIPIGAGLGGGSANAAAVIRGLLQFWGVSVNKEEIYTLLQGLGADVPVCYAGKSCFVEGIGEVIHPVSFDTSPEIYALLVYPKKLCATSAIFKNFKESFVSKEYVPTDFKNQEDFFSYLKNSKNSLTQSAQNFVPEIVEILSDLENMEGCHLARMSGSGSSCFGLFKDLNTCKNAYSNLKQMKPIWWAHPVTIRV